MAGNPGDVQDLNPIIDSLIDNNINYISPAKLRAVLKAIASRIQAPAGGNGLTAQDPLDYDPFSGILQIPSATVDRDGYLKKEDFQTFTEGAGGGTVTSVTGDTVDNTDPNNPIVNAASPDDVTDSLNAAKAYADGLVAGLLDLRGSYNPSSNLYPATGGSGTAGAVLKGDVWIISGNGVLGSKQVTAGDVIISLIDTPGQNSGNWSTVENNYGYVPENTINKQNSMAVDGTGLKFPTVDAVVAALLAKQETLVNTVNIKSIDGETLLGSGNIEIIRRMLAGSFGRNILYHVGQPGPLLNAIGTPMTNLGTNDPSGSGPTYAPTVGANSFTKMVRTRQVSAATAGSSAGHVQGSHRLFDNELSTSYFWSVRFGNEDLIPVLNARNSIGFGSDPGNLNPSNVNNIFCIGNDSGDTNLQIIHAGSGAATKIDLGINFPANTSTIDSYLFQFWKESGSSTISYYVKNYNNGFFVSGSVTTNMPVAGGYYYFIRRNNGATALAVKCSTNHALIVNNQ